MPLLDTTRQYQSGLAAYCRTGNLPSIPGIRQENIRQYRRLVYNIVEDMLENAYPLTKDLLTAKEWKTVVGDFFSNHPCHTPQVWYMPKEFYQYLSGSQHPLLEKYLFLKELLWFEWVELELYMMEDKAVPFSSSGDILFSRLVLNPEYQLFTFQYPVHRKNARYISASDKGSYYLSGHRNKVGEVRFTHLSPALASMIGFLATRPMSILELTETFRDTYTIRINDNDLQTVIAFFEQAYRDELIIGFKK